MSNGSFGFCGTLLGARGAVAFGRSALLVPGGITIGVASACPRKVGIEVDDRGIWGWVVGKEDVAMESIIV